MEMTETSQNQSTGQMLSEIIKNGSVFAFIAAFFYLYGFGLSAKVNILAYVSFTDYLRVAIGWIIPALGLPFLVGWITPDVISVIYTKKETESQVSNPLHKYKHRINKIFTCTIILFVIAIVLLIVNLLQYMDLKIIFLLSTLAGISGWMTIFIWYAKSVKNVIKLGFKNIRLLIWLPPLLIFSFGSGLSHGAMPKMLISNIYEIAVVNMDNGLQVYGELLFSFDKFTVMRESEHNELVFITSDKITSIRTPVPVPISTRMLPTNKR